MSRHRFPASKPRKMYWSDEVGGHTSCPTCRGPLESDHHTYIVATRLHGRMEFFMVGSADGNFCEKCPVVVLDRNVFIDAIAIGTEITEGAEFAVMGIVDLDAVPEDKRGLPFDDDTNPIPLVEFSNISRKTSSPKTYRKRLKSRKRKKRKGKRR